MPASCIYEDVTMVSTPYNPNPQQSLNDQQRTLSLALELMNSDDLMSQMAMGSFEDPNLLASMTEAERANKRSSQNMTECVTVPSSEHVAEIVGRQGCKIKALRAKTNTYIKTPVRGEEPIFVVTGRKEDVTNARREILSAADHFSQIRACRKNNLNGSMAPGPPVNVPGQVTISVRVPYRVVGLVVGPKGATIKRIQQQTQTYIVTPSRDKEPVFEVTGLPENVEAAKKEIEAHIAMRTGTLFEEEAVANIAASHNVSVEALLSNPEFMNVYRSTHNNLLGGGAANGVGTTSLNALLSSNTPSNSLSTLGLGSVLHGNQFNNFNSHVGSNGSSLSNGHVGLQHSLSNGSSNGSSYNSAINMLNTASGRSSGLLNNLSEISLSALSNAMSLNGGYNSQLDSQNHHPTSNNHFDLSSYSVLGETANNLLNAAKNPGMDTVVSTPSILNSFRNNRATDFTSMTSALPNSGGIDEGLGSLESSMGSSPALDQPHSIASNIWGDSKFSNPLPFSSYGSRNGFSSGEHTPSTRMSPTRLVSHESAHRSLSDPSPHMESLTNALSRLGPGNALYRRSNSSSPELGDIAAQSKLVGSLASTSSASMFQTSSAATSTSSMASNPDVSALLAGLSHTSCNDAEAAPSVGPIGSRRGSLDSAAASGSKICLSCQESAADAVLFPCGHNQLCIGCADKINNADGICPSCQSKIDKALQIRP